MSAVLFFQQISWHFGLVSQGPFAFAFFCVSVASTSSRRLQYFRWAYVSSSCFALPMAFWLIEFYNSFLFSFDIFSQMLKHKLIIFCDCIFSQNLKQKPSGSCLTNLLWTLFTRRSNCVILAYTRKHTHIVTQVCHFLIHSFLVSCSCCSVVLK